MSAHSAPQPPAAQRKSAHGAGGPLLAGVDVGSSRCKALLCTTDGAVLARARRATPYTADGLAHDPDELTAAALGALADCVRLAGRAPDAVGLTGMAETGVPLDRRLRALGPVLTWADPAPAEHAERLRRTLGGAALHARTGVLPSAKVPLARWCWLRERHPQRLARMRVWAGAADLVACALTGRVATDATFAQRTQAWCTPKSPGEPGRWSGELLAEAGLTPAQLPPVRAPGEPVGAITRAAAGSWGLRAGAPVVVAGHDHLVGAWAAGARTPGRAADSMGTAEAVLTVCAEPPALAPAAREGMSWGRHVDGEHWCTIAGMSGSGALVEWFCERFLPAGGRAPSGDGGGTGDGDSGGDERYRAFARLVAAPGGEEPGAAGAPPAVAQVPPPTGITVLPYPYGRSSPRPYRAARLAFHGVELRHGPRDFARALLEGAAYHARWMAEVQGELTGREPEAVTLLGGSTRQHTWTALKAAVAPWPTGLCAEPEAPGLGAAAFAGAALGLGPDAVAARVRTLTAGPDDAAAAHRTGYAERFLPLVRAERPADSGTYAES